MNLVENTTSYKSIILLQFTLTEPGLGLLTTESWKVITSLSYYCCMVNFVLTCKTRTHKHTRTQIKGARKGKNHILLSYFLVKHVLFPTYFSLNRVYHFYWLIFGYVLKWAGITSFANNFLHYGTCSSLHIQSNDMVASTRRSLSSVPWHQHMQLSLPDNIWRW